MSQERDIDHTSVEDEDTPSIPTKVSYNDVSSNTQLSDMGIVENKGTSKDNHPKIPNKVMMELYAAKVLYLNSQCVGHPEQQTHGVTGTTNQTDTPVKNMNNNDVLNSDISPYFTYFCPGIPTFHNSDGMMTHIVSSTNANIKAKINEVARTFINEMSSSNTDDDDGSSNNNNKCDDQSPSDKRHEANYETSCQDVERDDNKASTCAVEEVRKPILPYSRVTIDYRMYSAIPRSYYPKLVRRAQREQRRIIMADRRTPYCDHGDNCRGVVSSNSNDITGTPSGKSKSSVMKRVVTEQYNKENKENQQIDENDRGHPNSCLYCLSQRMEVVEIYNLERKRAMEDTHFRFGAPPEKSLGAKIAPDFFHGPYEEVNGLELVMENINYSDGTKVSSSVAPFLTKALSLLHEGDTAVVLVPAYLGTSPVLFVESRTMPGGGMWSHGKDGNNNNNISPVADTVYPPYIPYNAMTRGGVYQKRSTYIGNHSTSCELLNYKSNNEVRGNDNTSNSHLVRSISHSNPNENYNFHGRYMPRVNELYESNNLYENNYCGHGGNCFMYINVRSVIYETDLSYYIPNSIKSRYIVKHVLISGVPAWEVLNEGNQTNTQRHPITGSIVTFDISEVCPHMDYISPKIPSSGSVDRVNTPMALGHPAFEQRVEDMVVGGVHSCEELDIMLKSMTVNECASFRVGGSTVYLIKLLAVTVLDDKESNTNNKCGEVTEQCHSDGADVLTTFVLENFKCPANKLMSAVQKWNGCALNLISSLESPGNSPAGRKPQSKINKQKQQENRDIQPDTGVASCTTYSAASTPVISSGTLTKELVQACDSGALIDLTIGGCNAFGTLGNQGRHKILSYLSTVPIKPALMSYKHLVSHEILLISNEYQLPNSANSHGQIPPIQICSALNPTIEEIYWKIVYLYYTSAKLILSAEANTSVEPKSENNEDHDAEAASKHRLAAVSTLYSNAAQAFLYLKEYRAAAHFATQALRYDPDNAKTLYRRAQANLAIAASLRAAQESVNASDLEHIDNGTSKISSASVEAEYGRCGEAVVMDIKIIRSLYVQRQLLDDSPCWGSLKELEASAKRVLPTVYDERFIYL